MHSDIDVDANRKMWCHYFDDSTVPDRVYLDSSKTWIWQDMGYHFSTIDYQLTTVGTIPTRGSSSHKKAQFYCGK